MNQLHVVIHGLSMTESQTSEPLGFQSCLKTLYSTDGMLIKWPVGGTKLTGTGMIASLSSHKVVLILMCLTSPTQFCKVIPLFFSDSAVPRVRTAQ